MKVLVRSLFFLFFIGIDVFAALATENLPLLEYDQKLPKSPSARINYFYEDNTLSVPNNRITPPILNFLKGKDQKENVRLFYLSYKNKVDICSLRDNNPDFFNIFDQIFSSSLLGISKDYLLPYAMLSTRSFSTDSLIVSEKPNHPSSIEIESLSRRILTEGDEDLKCIESEIIEKAFRYLIQGTGVSGLHETYTYVGKDNIESKKKCYDELFSQALISLYTPSFSFHRKGWDSLRMFKETRQRNGLLSFTVDQNIYPPDMDVTAIVSSVLYNYSFLSFLDIQKISSFFFENTEDTGKFLVFFDKSKKRKDAVVSANVLSLLLTAYDYHDLDRQKKYIIEKNKEFILESVINNKETVYYSSSDFSLFLVSRLCKKFPELFSDLTVSLCDRMNRGREYEMKPVDCASRILVRNNLASGLSGTFYDNNQRLRDYHYLLGSQQEDGSWGYHPFYNKTSNTKTIWGDSRETYFVNKGLSTAVCMRALDGTIQQKSVRLAEKIIKKL